ncbi:hypothetical protein SCLCIDRAFT_19852 [Scleroderma citrinum Foug A]|uniref:Uncharacterized protein n=1 Tax=Scleroderma citrinum Foug A TaxID=1036808 RepID=A0A0C3A6C5_9AGAM|nr:hypothetical protein SCLCIDRAFT_19852 [Scleroderma citrinum Foug A]
MNLRLVMRRFVRLRDIRIVTRFGAHPWSSTSRQDSPCILYSKVSMSTGSRYRVRPRFNLDPTMLTPGSMDLTGTYRGVSLWLHSSGTFQPYRFDLVSSVSMPGSNDPTGMFRNIPMWLRGAGAFGQHFFHSHRVNAAATRCAAFVAISPVISVIAVLIAIAITSPLALNTRHNRLVSALNLSKHKRST